LLALQTGDDNAGPGRLVAAVVAVPMPVALSGPIQAGKTMLVNLLE
jgi:hypothetical protein